MSDQPLRFEGETVPVPSFYIVRDDLKKFSFIRRGLSIITENPGGLPAYDQDG